MDPESKREQISTAECFIRFLQTVIFSFSSLLMEHTTEFWILWLEVCNWSASWELFSNTVVHLLYWWLNQEGFTSNQASKSSNCQSDNIVYMEITLDNSSIPTTLLKGYFKWSESGGFMFSLSLSLSLQLWETRKVWWGHWRFWTVCL